MSKSHMIPSLAGLLGMAALGLGGCANDPIPATAELTYRKDASALLSRYCNECHQEGGIGPFALTSLKDATMHGDLMKKALEAGTMPPWMPSDKGLPIAYSRKMPQEHRQMLIKWIDGGMKEGSADQMARTDLPPPPSIEPPRPDLVLQPPEMYQPKEGTTDDYHCFVIDPKLTEDVYMQAANVRPDNKAILHHVLVFEIGKSAVADLMAKDASEPGPGYTCFGGPGVGTRTGITTVTGWAPGSAGSRSNGEAMIRIQAGSMLVMQMHYNLLNYKGVGDRSSVVMELTKTPPKRLAHMIPIARPDQLKIPKGDPNARQVISVPVGILESFLKWPLGEVTLWGNAPHMHTLGTRIATSVEDGPMLLEIPRWDFHWQGGYTFEKPYVLRQSDTIRVECEYDNSPANQPVINGQKKEPQDVTWGEGTHDEMCLSYILASPGGM